MLRYSYGAHFYIRRINQGMNWVQCNSRHVSNSYMFRNRSAISGSLQELRCATGLPEDGNQVPKHVETDFYHELHLMIWYIVLYWVILLDDTLKMFCFWRQFTAESIRL